MPTVLITGGTGLVGKTLSRLLVERGYEVIVLTRNVQGKPTDNPGITYAVWDVQQQTIDEHAVAKADHIIHLAGAGVADKRWTEERKKEIRDSRTESSRLLVKALKETPNQVQTVVSASAIGWYGEDRDRAKNKPAFTEEMPADKSFLGETCKLWEQSIEPVEQLGKRLVKIRIGIVLSNDGGAFVSFKQPVKFGIAAMLGNGKQMISWIHLYDLCQMFIYAVESRSMLGAYNAVAPGPVTNKSFTQQLASTIKGRFFIPIHVPVFVLKLLLGEMSVEVLKSTTVSCDKVRFAGFAFTYPTIEAALNELCSVPYKG
jgi:uncharacterized protein (TIGR01777 family)